MSLADWDALEERRRLDEYVATQLACATHRIRKARRAAARRNWCRFWLSPWHIAGHPGDRP